MQAPHPASRPAPQQFRAPQGAPQGVAPRVAPSPAGPAPGSAFQGPRNQYATPPARPGHLGAWMENHQGQSFANQENSLRQEPGFNKLPAPQQQRLIDRLHQLDAMPPEQRQRWLGRNENMERLSPEARQSVRNSVQELNTMEQGRRQQVRGAFRALSALPPDQRTRALNSPAYRSMYSDHERQMLGNLLSVEPYQAR